MTAADPPTPPTARHRAGPYGDPPTDRARPPVEPLILRDPETTLRWFTDHVTAAVRDQLAAEGLVPARAQTMHGRLSQSGPLPWFVGGLATALLVVLALTLTVWQVT